MTIRRDEGLLKISEVAEEAKVLPSTIRHYTDLGLLQFAATTEGGHRLYHAQDTLTRLSRVKALSKRGLSLPQIKDELNLLSGKKRVLVVDDEPEVGELISDALKDRPRFEVRVAMDGFAAGRALGEFLPDLVVLDLMLPGVNGFEVCKIIRADEGLTGVKILAVTGYSTPENVRTILQAGADKCLAKPMDLSEVLKSIGDLLNIDLTS
ncbi:MAG: response regulator [Elusimicrobia bacterium]|nr:response regulator [Elusimicrobiota bacterium]